MGRRIVEVYVAAVCFAATVSILLAAPHFFLARRVTAQALASAQMWSSSSAASHLESDHDRFEKEAERGETALSEYRAHRDYGFFVAGLIAGHVLLLIAFEVILWPRSQRPPRALSE
jgi:hypothetical protein